MVGWPGVPERWWGIYFLHMFSPFWRRWSDMIYVGWVQKFLKGDTSRGAMERTFNEWHEKVISKCPKEKLLVFDVKEGWEPLCKFLGKPIPNVPFPNTNDTEQMKKLHKMINVIGWIFLGLAVGTVSGLGYLAATKINH
jgi:hypothetical protein